MAEPLGIGLVEQLLVDTMSEIGAVAGRPFVKSARIVSALRDRHGVHLDQGYDALVDLAADWLVPLPLVEPHGNFGSPDFSPAGDRYTEARLRPAGVLARTGRPRLPFGLINGDLHAAGQRPAFAPTAVLDAVTLAAQGPDCRDGELLDLIGPPVAATGAAVDGDLDGLRAGRPTRLRYSSTIAVEGDAVVLTALPPGVGPFRVLTSLKARIGSPVSEGRLPIVSMDDESFGGHTRLVITFGPGTDPDRMLDRLLDVWPVSVDVTALLPTPLADLVRAEVDADRDAQLGALAALRSTLSDEFGPPGTSYRS